MTWKELQLLIKVSVTITQNKEILQHAGKECESLTKSSVTGNICHYRAFWYSILYISYKN